ncbi:MAG: sigma-54 dependent transcriptional regulator [Acidobacteriaceae bacterium]|jgi:DNA-binding NtrC family response regulator
MGYGLGREDAGNKAGARTVLLASANATLRARLRQELTAMRWQVREAAGGAEAIELLEAQGAEAMVLDSVLPDLEVDELAGEMRMRHPVMDLLRIDGVADDGAARSPRRNELLHALRQARQDACGAGAGDSAAWMQAPVAAPQIAVGERLAPGDERSIATLQTAAFLHRSKVKIAEGPLPELLPGMVGVSAVMVELARLIRLVAPHESTVLIEGETGTGKERVARAVHQLSPRADKPYVVLNCAAIPESLLEAEVFGHTRGAFTGAIQPRTGMIEAANGGTLFLDEIGEMPLSMQSKILRFLESGELQRVGNNEVVRVDARVVAATHEPLQRRADEHTFRLDLYHRLAVFPVFVPALRERMVDLLPLAAHLLGKLGKKMPVKRLSDGAAERLTEHHWPGNVRELEHVLERATILAEDRREIAREEIWF